VKTVFLLGQAPPSTAAAVPYERTRLWKWFAEVGISRESFLWDFQALVTVFPGREDAGGDVAPSSVEIEANRTRLLEHLEQTRPDLLVAVGALAGRFFMESEGLPTGSLDQMVGKSFEWGVERVPLVVLPHPSGRSSWPYSSPERGKLLERGLETIATQLGVDGITPS
jgi:uracil-DNA glycosylase